MLAGQLQQIIQGIVVGLQKNAMKNMGGMGGMGGMGMGGMG